MKNIMGELWGDMVVDGDWLSRTVSALLLSTVLMLLALCIWIGVYLADSIFIVESETRAKVTGKTYSPAYTSRIPVSTGKTTIMMPQHNPESYHVDLSSTEGSGSVAVPREFFETVKTDMCFWISYKTGRFSGDFYATGIIKPSRRCED